MNCYTTLLVLVLGSFALIGCGTTTAADHTGGFDGQRAFKHVTKQVGFGPRPSGSTANRRLQAYIQAELMRYGCEVETERFDVDTPVGRLPMTNIVAKIPGDKPGILILATHYDTKRMSNFVGADDGGSSTAMMMELARLLCRKPSTYRVWITFFDGEEATKHWNAKDSCYGSRHMATKMRMSGEISKVRAFLLADMVGARTLRFRAETNSSPDLTELFWKTAANLGYRSVFVTTPPGRPIEDDHLSFKKHGVPVLNVIDLDAQLSYWHTPQDTLDKLSAKSLATTGHVFLESIKVLQSR